MHLWENHVWVCAAWTPSQRGKAATLYPSFVGCFCPSCERIPETGDQIWAEKPAREKVTMKWGLQVRRGNIRTPISNCSIHKVKPGICEQISKWGFGWDFQFHVRYTTQFKWHWKTNKQQEQGLKDYFKCKPVVRLKWKSCPVLNPSHMGNTTTSFEPLATVLEVDDDCQSQGTVIITFPFSVSLLDIRG